jgi:2-polyprenyl-3-methyl-5-hydroxy-6-metoxy-1,4-benzoquinol methylase
MSHNKNGHPLVCPPWLCFTFDNRLRRLIQNPAKILGSFVRPGDNALDIGPGMGYFSIPLARMVGPAGRVTAIDIQEKMLAALTRRAEKSGVSQIVRAYLATPESLGDHPKADFVLTFWMVHELPDQRPFLTQIFNLMKPGGRIHVTAKAFARTLAIAAEIGFVVKERPKVSVSHGALLTRG